MKRMTIFTILILLAFCISAAGTQSQPKHDSVTYYMKVNVTTSCDGNVVVVKARNETLPGAHVSVKDTSTADLITTGDTDANGTFVFDACGSKVDVKVTSEDYPSETVSAWLIDCGQCNSPELVCTDDSQCAASEECQNAACVPIECQCGTVGNHECVDYECCSDTQCQGGKVCVNHTCQSRTPQNTTQNTTGGCHSNTDCAQTQYCQTAATNAAGSCKNVPNPGCGQISNHTFAAYGYECGTEEGCPSCQEGYDCISHKCVQNDVTCPPQGVVGASPTCDATENGKPCVGCDYVVTDPSGKNSTGRTDENGSFSVPLGVAGTYQVSLLKNGSIVKVIEVKANPAAAGGQESGKPTAAAMDATPIIIGVLVLLLLAAAIFFWRSRAAKK